MWQACSFQIVLVLVRIKMKCAWKKKSEKCVKVAKQMWLNINNLEDLEIDIY